MRLAQLAISIILAVLTCVAFVVPTGVWAIALRIAICVTAVGQAVLVFCMVQSTAKTRAAMRVELQEQLAPLAAMLKLIPLAPAQDRHDRVSSFLSSATASCVNLSDEKKLRATYFEAAIDGGVRTFRPTTLSFGRGDKPVSTFAEGDGGEGESVWERAREGEYRHEVDIRRNPPPYMDTRRKRKYRSFITVPVLVSGDPVALLTMNSPRRNGLTSEDVVAMQMIADLCVAAIAADGGRTPTFGR